MTGPLLPAAHTAPEGALRGWSAADVHPDEYTGDDYADQFPVVQQPEDDQ